MWGLLGTYRVNKCKRLPRMVFHNDSQISSTQALTHATRKRRKLRLEKSSVDRDSVHGLQLLPPVATSVVLFVFQVADEHLQAPLHQLWQRLG